MQGIISDYLIVGGIIGGCWCGVVLLLVELLVVVDVEFMELLVNVVVELMEWMRLMLEFPSWFCSGSWSKFAGKLSCGGLLVVLSFF